MKIDIEDILFWMDAIRNSEDRYRTLESFWKGQVNSKIWLIKELQKLQNTAWHSITIYGGWNGVLASLIFNSAIKVEHIKSVDIDPLCEETANTINKRYHMAGRFEAETEDMCNYSSNSDVIINTSCEHLTQEQYDTWLEKQSNTSLIVLQSNNFFTHEEHIRCANGIDDFTSQSNILPLFRGVFPTEKYDRYMIIGKKK